MAILIICCMLHKVQFELWILNQAWKRRHPYPSNVNYLLARSLSSLNENEKSQLCSQQRLWLIVSMKSCSQPGKNPGHPHPKQPNCLEFSPLYREQYSLLFSCYRVWLFVTLWTTAHQASLPFTVSRSLVKLMSIKSWCHPTISSSIAPFSSCPQSFPSSWSFPMNQLFASGGQSIGASASASVLPMNI